MLVLSRKPGEAILLKDSNGNLRGKIHIVSVLGKRVKIGLTMPDEVIVLREELEFPAVADLNQPPVMPVSAS